MPSLTLSDGRPDCRKGADSDYIPYMFLTNESPHLNGDSIDIGKQREWFEAPSTQRPFPDLLRCWTSIFWDDHFSGKHTQFVVFFP